MDDGILGDGADELDPLGFLRAVMAGVDPRRHSDIWNLAQAIEAENLGDPPTAIQWQALLDIIEDQHRFRPVGMDQSQRAAMTLAEYEHPKRKSVELTTDGAAVEVPELTAGDFELFEEWFNEQF